ncbi:hypothetical protein PLESTB_000007000 [Pleodorina starrii]|uniref:Uncharacterized protein n=1 Tax=Pleodorina starrii TaxID=330485 RepID=A0A9W6B807_9CHLO|nr:hypothetical protein PLESTM_000840200 [Pleodorina starrii]GLC47612.1 hypothetical protein PLESTB_000007000 [Pleodorina starrii]GLC75620.1 hypothetical protein PLESTF_001666000 [Pleodorina starrii]
MWVRAGYLSGGPWAPAWVEATGECVSCACCVVSCRAFRDDDEDDDDNKMILPMVAILETFGGSGGGDVLLMGVPPCALCVVVNLGTGGCGCRFLLKSGGR